MLVANIVLVVLIVLVVIFILNILKRKKLQENDRKNKHHNKREDHRHHTTAASIPNVETVHYELSPTELTKINTKHPKPNIVPTFSRQNDVSEFRFEVSASGKNSGDLPKSFSAIKNWPNLIVGVFDQEHCSNCWSYACCSLFTDRIRIASNGKYLKDGDYISPTSFAACSKCGVEGACSRACEGNYLDDVLQFMVDYGAVAQSDIDKHSDSPEAYVCFDAKAKGVKLWKGKERHRVNIFPPSMLNTSENLKANMEAMMREILKNGTIVTVFKIYVPADHRNFYLHKEGVYGYGWKEEPKESDGYHAIGIVGWGSEDVVNKYGVKEVVPYWIIRNSWGDWGLSHGFAKILRGSNLGYIESDCFAMTPDV